MREVKDIAWFKKAIVPTLKNYELNYRFFEEGDFGSLSQFELNSEKIGVVIDFWGLGWLGIFVWDYQKEEQLLNILLEAHQEDEKDKAFEELQSLL
ncbi:MAG: hypothetical protein WBP45_11505 [Daejeonella sp.]